jgi:hypothetical protein
MKARGPAGTKAVTTKDQKIEFASYDCQNRNAIRQIFLFG